MGSHISTVRDYDVFTPEATADHNAFLHRVRAESPLARLPQLDAYLLTRHADINAALRDKRMDTADMAQVLQRLTPAEQTELEPLRRSLDMWVGHTDPADHVRFQKLLKRYFTPAMVDRLRPRVRAFTHELLDLVAPGGRMEVVRRSPTVVLDAAHNPHGARAAAAAITEAFGFTPLIGVVAVMADKDARGVLEAYEEIMNQVVVTQVASTSRGTPAGELGELAAEIFGADRVMVVPRLDDALEQAVSMAEVEGVGAPGVLVTGSVVAVGEARTLLVTNAEPVRPSTSGDDPDDDWDGDYSEDGEPADDGRGSNEEQW